jgi:mono/diheme cytochrome c family protein
MPLVAAFVLLLTLAVPASAGPVEHGRSLAKDFCGPCHALGRTGASPHPAAPPLRQLGQFYDIDALPRRLERGISSGHPDMPVVKFRSQDARDLRAYLRSIQQ